MYYRCIIRGCYGIDGRGRFRYMSHEIMFLVPQSLLSAVVDHSVFCVALGGK